MRRQAQASIEYLLLVGFVLTIFIPVSIFTYSTYNEYKSTLQSRQVMTALSTISEHAQSVYNIGPPSFSTVQIYFPSSVTELYIINKTITARILTSSGTDDITVYGTVPLSGTLTVREGTRKVLVTAATNGVIITEP